MKATIERQRRHNDRALDARYGKIGIAAIAAAVRYKGAPKPTKAAPVRPDARSRNAEPDTSQSV
jgi:hypothetical protein